jgi:hypothetical protein
MANSTTDYIREFNKRVTILEQRKWMFPIVSTTHDEQLERLFEKGIKGNNRQIGQYKSEEYKKQRKKRGRQTSFVDLKFTNELQQDFGNSITPTKTGFITGVKKKGKSKSGATNGQKVDFLKDRYGDELWKITPKETKQYQSRMKKAINKILS